MRGILWSQPAIVSEAFGQLAPRLIERILIRDERAVLRRQRDRGFLRLTLGVHSGPDVMAVLVHVFRPHELVADEELRPTQSLLAILQPMNLQVVLIKRLP